VNTLPIFKRFIERADALVKRVTPAADLSALPRH
jgi:hypothetical protein